MRPTDHLRLTVVATRVIGGALLLLALLVAVARPAAADDERALRRFIEGANSARAEVGSPPLSEDPLLDQIARERSRDMATYKYLGHVSASGETVFDLLGKRGVSFSNAAENVSWSSGYGDRSAGVALEGFLQSQHHRDNLLNPSFNYVGVGLSYAGGEAFLAMVLVE